MDISYLYLYHTYIISLIWMAYGKFYRSSSMCYIMRRKFAYRGMEVELSAGDSRNAVRMP